MLNVYLVVWSTCLILLCPLCLFTRLAILSNFPETLQPSQYDDLLPEVR